MPKILRTGIVGDDMMDVHLDNGHILMVSLSSVLDLPGFATLREDDQILYPKTDGNCVFWRNSPSLPLEEMLRLLNEEKQE